MRQMRTVGVELVWYCGIMRGQFAWVGIMLGLCRQAAADLFVSPLSASGVRSTQDMILGSTEAERA